MVDGGFVTLNPKDVPIKGFAPPANWRQHPQEWIIQYSRPKAISPFVLRCSLQEATGRLFIHASETGPDHMPRRENIQVLGLQLANYTSKERCDSKSWEDVIQNERTLLEMFREFVSRPLWEAANREFDAEGDEDAENAGGNGVATSSSEKPKTATTTTTSLNIYNETDKNGTATDSSLKAGDGTTKSGSSGVSNALSSFHKIGLTRKNVLLAAAVGSGAATAFYFYKNYKETGKYVPAGVEKLIPPSLRK
jgi:hypothetical protein